MQVAIAQQAVVQGVNVQLTVGDTLKITSTHTSIVRVAIEGNLSYASMTKPPQYPADSFAISTIVPGSYSLRVFFNYSDDYEINVITQSGNRSLPVTNSTYYVSSGSFELDVKATFNPQADIPVVAGPPEPPWQGFVRWVRSFSKAFPTWVKLVYLAFGVQFFAVGGLWIRRETRKKEAGAQHLDAGDKAFLWVDIAYKFLLASFLTILAIMGGEVLVLFMLRFMFLVTLNLLSLWDLFVVGFAAGILVIAYLVRFTPERAFDLKPMEND
jgi:hypothetical protein